MYVAEGTPDAASDAALGLARRHLELDFEQVEWIHAEHGRRARGDPSERVVLQDQTVSVSCESVKGGVSGVGAFAYECMCWEEARV